MKNINSYKIFESINSLLLTRDIFLDLDLDYKLYINYFSIDYNTMSSWTGDDGGNFSAIRIWIKPKTNYLFTTEELEEISDSYLSRAAEISNTEVTVYINSNWNKNFLHYFTDKKFLRDKNMNEFPNPKRISSILVYIK